MKLLETKQQGQTIAELVDRAGILKDQAAAIGAEYLEVRRQLEQYMQGQCQEDDNLDVLMGKKTLTESGGRYEATYKLGKKRNVLVKTLYKKREALFWKLAKIGISDLEKVIGDVEASEFIKTSYADAPTLEIKEKKQSTSKQQTAPQLRAVA